MAPSELQKVFLSMMCAGTFAFATLLAKRRWRAAKKPKYNECRHPELLEIDFDTLDSRAYDAFVMRSLML